MAMAKSVEEREFWREFIAVYRDLPELWKVKSEEYKNRNKKKMAYEKLAKKLKEIDPKANRDLVRAKINALRTSYRRELKKVKDSRKSGGKPEDRHVPNLWYFNDIDFLRDQEAQIQEVSGMDGTEIDEMDEINDTVAEDSFSYLPPQCQPTPKRKMTHRNNTPPDIEEAKRVRLLGVPCECILSPTSDSNILAKGWAIEFDKMRADQQLYAKKFIDDILFEGRLGNLSRYSITINHAPQSVNYHSTGNSRVASGQPKPENELGLQTNKPNEQ